MLIEAVAGLVKALDAARKSATQETAQAVLDAFDALLLVDNDDAAAPPPEPAEARPEVYGWMKQ